MKNVKEGVIKTDSNCIGCNRCISSCPVKKANVALYQNGHFKMKANADRCIDCGACIKACNSGARRFDDDMDSLRKLIDEQERFSVLIDPAFFINHPDDASHIIGFLKSLGAEKVYNGGMGTELSIWAHVEYIKNHAEDENRAVLTSHCSATLNYIRKYQPDMLNLLIPVMSPMMCAAKYARKYQNDHNKLVLITACPATRQEASEFSGLVDYFVGIDSIINFIGKKDISSFNGEADTYVGEMGAMSSLEGGFKRILDLFIWEDRMSPFKQGIDKDFLNSVKDLCQNKLTRPNYVDIAMCEHGCTSGANARKKQVKPVDFNVKLIEVFEAVKGVEKASPDYDQRYMYFTDYLKHNFGEMNVEDFSASYDSDYRQSYNIPDNVYNEIFKMMHKEEKWKQHIDCGSCGYSSCMEMVRCIVYGYNHKENCIHYMNDELTNRYYTDSLTKIPNKEGFKVKIRELYNMYPDKDYVIGALSLNQLNMMNDMYGFMVGDELIKRASLVCKNFAEDGNGIAARLGAGEFILCFENTQEMADRICNAQTYSFEDGNISQPISFRAGLYVDHDRNVDVDTMINYASLARDRIEEDGVNTCMFYNADLRSKLDKEAMVTSTMYDAVKNREFVAYLQPKFSHSTKQIVGAEILCRWIKPDGSIVSPGLFIPMFEKNGFIKILDKYMWDLAFRMILEWDRMGIYTVPVSVNISRVSLAQPDFVDTIKELSDRYMIDKDRLHFEITESAYSERMEEVSEKLNAVRELGYKIAIDDFGSGYSSLTVLKDMPIDILKLDMGFFKGGNEEKGKKIISNVVNMTKELDLDIIAEGVESRMQADYLGEVGCDVIQGYLYAKPMPVKDYENLLSKNHYEYIQNMK